MLSALPGRLPLFAPPLHAAFGASFLQEKDDYLDPPVQFLSSFGMSSRLGSLLENPKKEQHWQNQEVVTTVCTRVSPPTTGQKKQRPAPFLIHLLRFRGEPAGVGGWGQAIALPSFWVYLTLGPCRSRPRLNPTIR